MPSVQGRIRASRETLAKVKATARAQNLSVSKFLCKAIAPYTRGRKTLPPNNRGDYVSTTFVISHQELEVFKDHATAADLSLDEAMRIAVHNHLEELQRIDQLNEDQ